MRILGVIVEGAKTVAVIVLLTAVFAFFKYIYLRFRGLLPSVAATVFVISIIQANFNQFFDFCALMWSRFVSILRSFSGDITRFLTVFAVTLCCAIAKKLDISVRRLFEMLKTKCKAKRARMGACNLSNSYLAITPVLLS